LQVLPPAAFASRSGSRWITVSRFRVSFFRALFFMRGSFHLE